MSLDLPQAQAEPVTSVEQLVAELRAAEKPRARHRLGLEHEKFVYRQRGEAAPVPYEGPTGIGALLEALVQRGGSAFQEASEHPTIAVLRGELTVSLEPGGQFELSGSPHRTARAVHAENLAHLEETKALASALGQRLVALGYRPFGTPAQMPWMPKSRYEVMRRTLGPRGALAYDMMLMTCTGQVSLDWESEEDCARKMTVLARAAPALVALYANSPLVDGHRASYLSYRSHVWTQVDPARCGFFPAMVDGSFSYRAYVEWALDAPLLFIRRDGEYLTPLLTFRELLARGFGGAPATLQDWRDHLSTLFPELRLKRVLEIRSADSVNAALTGALAAFLRGLVYDDIALREAEALLPSVAFADHEAQMERARREGLRDQGLADQARALVAVARRGLLRLDEGDLPILAPLEELASRGRSPAEEVLAVAGRGASPSELLEAFRL